MLPSTVDRVPEQTAEHVHERICQRMRDRVGIQAIHAVEA